jgi:hypothetical protein
MGAETEIEKVAEIDTVEGPTSKKEVPKKMTLVIIVEKLDTGNNSYTYSLHLVFYFIFNQSNFTLYRGGWGSFTKSFNFSFLRDSISFNYSH